MASPIGEARDGLLAVGTIGAPDGVPSLPAIGDMRKAAKVKAVRAAKEKAVGNHGATNKAKTPVGMR